MNLQIFSPPPILQKYVRYFWTADNDSSSQTHEEINTIVDDSSGIIFQHFNGHSSFIHENNERVKIALAYGKRTNPTKTVSDMPFSVTGVNFTSQGIKLILGIDSLELTNTLVSLDDITSKTIIEQLLDQKDHSSRIRVLTSFILGQIKEGRDEDKLVSDVCLKIRSGGFNRRIADLARAYGISERQLERRFKHAIGLSPKLYMRIIKCQRALDQITTGQCNSFCELAYEFGYSDQSRLISDFREFTNYTPGQIMQNIRKILALQEK